MAMNVEAEIRDLKRRVGEIEGSFGFLTQQIKAVHKDLLAFEEKTDKKLQEHDGRFDRVDQRFDRLETKVDGLDRKIDSKIDGLTKALPGIVGDAMRDVLREQQPKPRKTP
jgi:predicted nuclease with TOPRIM domain